MRSKSKPVETMVLVEWLAARMQPAPDLAEALAYAERRVALVEQYTERRAPFSPRELVDGALEVARRGAAAWELLDVPLARHLKYVIRCRTALELFDRPAHRLRGAA